MKNIFAEMNKLLLVFAVLAMLFFFAMLAMFKLQPVDNWQQQIQLTATQAADAQAALDQRLAQAQTGLEEAQTANAALQAQIAELETAKQETQEACTALEEQIDAMHCLPETILQVREEYGNKVRQLEEMIMAGETDIKICYLTLDDGPNNLTASIIQRLDELDIQVTFFTIGTNDALGQTENLRAEMMGGHTIANHTYSHAYNGLLYKDFENFKLQVEKQDQKVFEATGFHTDIFRFPSGSSACPFLTKATTWLEENGYQWIDWNANAYDAGLHALDDPGYMVGSRMMSSCEGKDIAVILCHDFNYGTYSALKDFVPQMQEAGYVFLPLFPQCHIFDEPLKVV